MIENWEEMKFWKSGEWDVIRERLQRIEGFYNPSRENLFRALDICPFNIIRVCIVGQDPYPNPAMATGVAFSVPEDIEKLPPTLLCILQEYYKDLNLPNVRNGCLENWCDQGVLLWNSVPTYEPGIDAEGNKYNRHSSWDEWTYLTKEVVKELSNKKGVVFAFLGARAREYSSYVDITSKEGKPNNCVITTAHPSPLSRSTKKRNIFNPFLGSRIFSTINSKLVQMGQEPVDWSL